MPQPVCSGPIAWKDFDAVRKDIDNLKASAGDGDRQEVFMTSTSPGVVANFLPNDYHPSHGACLRALAAVMKDEYAAIVGAGFVLQIDCPDLAMTRPSQWAELTVNEFKDIIALQISVLNESLADLPPDRMGLHMCWVNFEGPHAYDVPLSNYLKMVMGESGGGFPPCILI